MCWWMLARVLALAAPLWVRATKYSDPAGTVRSLNLLLALQLADIFLHVATDKVEFTHLFANWIVIVYSLWGENAISGGARAAARGQCGSKRGSQLADRA